MTPRVARPLLSTLIMTSQFEVKVWYDLVGNPTLGDAVMERILSHHHEIVLKGESIRPLEKENSGDGGDKRSSRADSPQTSAKTKEARA